MARLARLVRTVLNLSEKVLEDPQPVPVNLGDGGYADRVCIGLLALREARTDTYDEVFDRVATTPLSWPDSTLTRNWRGRRLRVQFAKLQTA